MPSTQVAGLVFAALSLSSAASRLVRASALELRSVQSDRARGFQAQFTHLSTHLLQLPLCFWANALQKLGVRSEALEQRATIAVQWIASRLNCRHARPRPGAQTLDRLSRRQPKTACWARRRSNFDQRCPHLIG